MGTLLEVRDLTVVYRPKEAKSHRAVESVSFEIASGEVLGLMGESGCGKTSIALGLLGLLPKDACSVTGSLFFRGQELLSRNERELQAIRGAEISAVFQEPGLALSPFLRVGDQISEVIHAHGHSSWKECRAEADSALVQMGFSEPQRIYNAYPHQLSGGQLQRVVLAQALASRPALVIADEPTASLDAQTQVEILALLGELRRQLGISFLLISHTPEIQASLADRVLVMEEGQIVEQGTVVQLFRNPSRAYTKALLRGNPPRNAIRDSEIPGIAQEHLVT